MTRPLIGLSGRRRKGHQLVGNIDVVSEFDVDLYYANYARSVLEAGGLPIHLPLDVDPADMVGRLDGLLLTGGADIGPHRYDAEPETNDFPPEAERDDFELKMLGQAIDRAVPTLGICRGIQLLNVQAGGTLHQHIPEHAAYDHSATTEWHQIAIEPDSALGGLYGESRGVNSLHHQTVDQVGANLRVTARADDGTVEGLEHNELPAVAVQWHPEMMTGWATDPIFAWLVDAARATMGAATSA